MLIETHHNMDRVAKCASLIAYMEGFLGRPLAKTAHDFDPAALEKRLADLERATGLSSAAPFESSSWNGIVWRAWQLRYRGVMSGKLFDSPVEEYDDMLDGDLTLASLQRVVVAGLGANYPTIACPRCDKDGAAANEEEGDDEACLGVLVQRLCHISGARRLSFPAHAWTRARICAYAAGLSFPMAGAVMVSHHAMATRTVDGKSNHVRRSRAAPIPLGVRIVDAPRPGMGRVVMMRHRQRQRSFPGWLGIKRWFRQIKARNSVSDGSSPGSGGSVVEERTERRV